MRLAHVAMPEVAQPHQPLHVEIDQHIGDLIADVLIFHQAFAVEISFLTMVDEPLKQRLFGDTATDRHALVQDSCSPLSSRCFRRRRDISPAL
jgi:hypothetical protein